MAVSTFPCQNPVGRVAVAHSWAWGWEGKLWAGAYFGELWAGAAATHRIEPPVPLISCYAEAVSAWTVSAFCPGVKATALSPAGADWPGS